jgi:hypothetical protein
MATAHAIAERRERKYRANHPPKHARHLSDAQIVYFGTPSQKRRLGIKDMSSPSHNSPKKRVSTRIRAQTRISHGRVKASATRSRTTVKRSVRSTRSTKQGASKSGTNWLATIGAGLGGLAVGTAGGLAFGNSTLGQDVKQVLSKVPVIGGLFANNQVSNPIVVAPGSIAPPPMVSNPTLPQFANGFGIGTTYNAPPSDYVSPSDPNYSNVNA